MDLAASLPGLPRGALIPLAFLLGGVIGSFLNVCIHRLPRDESIVHPRSRCPACGREIRWYENVPLLSFLFLRGRCRGCRARISPVYPLVEGLMAASLAFLVARWGLSFEFLYSAAFAGLLIALAFIDLRHYLLPDVLTLPGGLLGLMGAFWSQRVDWKASLAGLGIGVGGLLAVILLYYLVRRREGMGMGDVKMLGMMGAFLGWQWMLLALMIAVMAGTVVGLLAILIRGKSFQYALPFGTFLSLGGLVTLYWGDGLASLLFPGL